MDIQKGRRVLLVEDEAVISMVTAKMLKRNGYDVITANNGEKAVEKALSDTSIDIILMDIDLGTGINGPDAARRILEILNIPIVFLTSHSEQRVVEMVREITRYGYVIKNSGDFVLLSSIEMAFELFDSHERLRASAEVLKQSETRVRTKLDSILSPDGDAGALELADIVDTKMLQSLMDDYYSITGTGVGIIDLKGNVLVATGWQDICTRFHRANPESCRFCVESDTLLTAGVETGAFKLYKCKNNMWDMATPVEVGGRHVGNLFLGQFLFNDEVIDYDLFRIQARQFGFKENEYIAALERVPRWSREFVESAMSFYIKLLNIISRLSYSNIKLAGTLAERDRLSDLHRESEVRLREVTDYMVDLVARLDADGVFIYVSPSHERILGYRQEELAGTRASDILHPSSMERDIADIAAMCSSGEGFVELRQRHKDGTYRWFEVTGSYIRDDKGRITGAVLGGRDITGRKITEQKLNKRNRQYRDLFESMVDGFAFHEIIVDDWGKPVDYVFLEANSAFESCTGLIPSEIKGKSVKELIPDIEPHLIAAYGQVALTGVQLTIENYSGKLNKWFKVTAYSSERGYFATIYEDITERKLAETLLKERDERYKRLFDSVVGYVYTVFIVNSVPVRTVHGPGCEAITGYTPAEFDADPELWYKMIYPDDRGRVVLFASDIINRRVFSPIEHRIVCRDGSLTWVRNTPVPHYDADKNLIEYDSIIADINERKLAEISLKENSSMLLNIINSSPDYIYVKDTDLKLVLCNEAFASALHRKPAELTGLSDIECGWDPDYVRGNLRKGLRGWEQDERRALSGKKVTAENEKISVNGEIRFFDSLKIPLYNNGKISSILGISRDMTERLKAVYEKKAIIDLLGIINTESDLHDFMKAVIMFLKSWSGCQAVGIRLKDGDDYPYFETDGFPQEFTRLENSLCTYDLAGQLLRNEFGEPLLECMCGNVINGRFDPSRTFFTEHGSFCTNCTTELLSTTTEEERQAQTRNRCNGMGYESVALIPLRWGNKTFGLIQLNDKRRGLFNGELIRMFERLGDSISVALSEKLTRKELEENEARYRTVANFTYDWEFWIGPDGKMIYCSPSCKRITGYTCEEFMNDRSLLRGIVFPDDSNSPCVRDNEVSEYPEFNEIEFRITRKDGEVRWIGHVCRAVYDENGRFTGRRGSNRDVSEARKAYERINTLLREKELLLSEVHHRVKNNMNTVAGLLMLQAASMSDETAVNALNDARNRVHSMMIMYDRLYRSEDYGKLKVRDYFEKFIDEIFILLVCSDRISLKKDIDDFILDTKIVFPLGIAINELITNAFKYAYPDGRRGVIEISIKKTDNGIRLLISDDGIGIPDEVISARTGGFGLNLVSALAEQIGGELVITNCKGTAVELILDC